MTSFTRTARYQACQALFDRTYPDFRDAGTRYADLVDGLVTGTSVVLDIGAGRMSFAADSIGRARFAVGVDLVASDLRHNLTLRHVLVADAERLPFYDETFDLVVSQWVVEHFAHPERAFTEIARVLRPGGSVVLFTTNAWNYVPLAARMLPDRLRDGILRRVLRRPEHESHPVYYRANSRGAITRLAEASGLEVRSVEFVGNPFYLAFSPALFRVALAFERVTDVAELQAAKLYLLATLGKPG